MVGVHLSENEKGFVTALLQQQFSYTRIMKEFLNYFCKKISKSTVSRIKNAKAQVNSKKGPKRKTDSKQDSVILKVVEENRFMSWARIKGILYLKNKIDVSAQTLRRRCKEKGVKSYMRLKKHKLDYRVSNLRKQWAQEFATKSKTFWRNTAFIDEKTILLYGEFEGGNNYVKCRKHQRLDNKNVIPRRKYNFKGIKFFGVVSCKGPGALIKLNGFNGKIIEEVIESIEPVFRKWKIKRVVQDNDPVHNCPRAQRAYRRIGVEILRMPPSSPDINMYV
jgi:hypothetical protein